jgi:vacuolar-type H+-ATPase subunit D/Vma8
MSGTGREGKIRVERRLETARHGAQLLDRKQHILADELERLRLQANRSRREWENQARDAAAWLGRAAALDGTEQIASVAPLLPVQVELRWGGAMGILYPEEARSLLPPQRSMTGSSALSYTAAAHRTALEAAVRHAAVERALLLVSAELAATRTRQRAVENRWIPRLEGQLLSIRRELDEQELEESLRLRWAAGRTPARRTAGEQGGEP